MRRNSYSNSLGGGGDQRQLINGVGKASSIKAQASGKPQADIKNPSDCKYST
jgi:hypothetical protein